MKRYPFITKWQGLLLRKIAKLYQNVATYKKKSCKYQFPELKADFFMKYIEILPKFKNNEEYMYHEKL